MNHTLIDPFEELLNLEKQARMHMRALPRLEDAIHYEVGLWYRLDSFSCISSLSNIKEVLPRTDLVEVPGLKEWALGLMNVRGDLVLVSDLWGFLKGRDQAISYQEKILLVQHQEALYGLMIDQLLGLKKWKKNQEKEKKLELPKALKHLDDFIVDVIEEEKEYIYHLDLRKIVATPAFKRVGVENIHGGSDD